MSVRVRHIIGLAALAAVALLPARAPAAEEGWSAHPVPLLVNSGNRHGMVYDSARDELVLFGDVHGGPNTWLRRDGVWRPGAPGPRPRFGHAMAFDSVRRETVLFGGYVTLTGCSSNREPGPIDDCVEYLSAETWTWNGTTWNQKSKFFAPERFYHAMAFDEARGRVILFGGLDSTFEEQNDTWEYDGARWRRLNPTTVPPSRFSHSMFWDAGRQRIVMYGGFGSSLLDDMWEWNGIDWVRRPTNTGPGPRYHHDMAYDTRRNVALLFGGDGTGGWSDFRGDTWEWNGTQWRHVATPVSPSARVNHVMAYDPGDDVIVLVGGFTEGLEFDTLIFSTTWEFRAS